MGYHASLTRGEAIIPGDQAAAALAALKAVEVEDYMGRMVGLGYIDRCDTLDQALREFGFEFTGDADSEYSIEWFESKWRDHDDFLAALSPFVDPTADLWFRGEDGDEWVIRLGGEQAVYGEIIKTVKF